MEKTKMIKYRVWDKRNKTFVSCERFYNLDGDSGQLLIDCAGQIRMATYPIDNGDNLADSVFYPIENQGDYVVQQYAGFKDVNGREIYEGDVVFADEGTWIVGFTDGCFGLKADEEDKLTPLFEYGPKELMVIGNVFENHTHE
jgi:uncharacterized phage protein (TIGR01671 family)